jgi:hypothetical protein
MTTVTSTPGLKVTLDGTILEFVLGALPDTSKPAAIGKTWCLSARASLTAATKNGQKLKIPSQPTSIPWSRFPLAVTGFDLDLLNSSVHNTRSPLRSPIYADANGDQVFGPWGVKN